MPPDERSTSIAMGQVKDNSRMAGDTPPFKNPLFLAAAVLYALALMSSGLQRPLFCDEGSFLKNVCHFGVFRTAEPVFTNYPTFYSYLLAVPMYLAYFIYYVFVRGFPWEGLMDQRLFALVFQGDVDIWLKAGRLTGILFALGILALLYRYCTPRLGRPALAAVLLLVISSPYRDYMSYARYALPDIFVAFLATAVLYIAARHTERPGEKSLYAAGFLAGLAASAKLNGALALAPLLVVPWLAKSGGGQKFRAVSLILVCAALGFLAGSPYVVLKPELFCSGFGVESQLLYSSSGGQHFFWLLRDLWREAPVMTALIAGALGFSVWRHSPKDILFHSILIASIIFLGGLTKRMPHYFLFLFPWACVMIGEAFQAALDLARRRALRLVLAVVMAGAVGYECCRLSERVLADSRKDNQFLAQDWVRKNITKDTLVLLDWNAVPMGFLDLAVVSPNEYFLNNCFQSIVREYVQSKFYGRFHYVPSYSATPACLKAEGWEYFITAEDCFEPYLKDPGSLDAVEAGSNSTFIQYLQRRTFYYRIFRENAGVRVFQEGSGPRVYIFKLR